MKRLHTQGYLASRQHGTRSRYQAGCDCKRCTQANRDYARAYLHRRLSQGLVDNHGKRLAS